ncbi:MAG: Kazal-type serine protease inhibitor domain-containing protein [Myxococcota bacterium]
MRETLWLFGLLLVAGCSDDVAPLGGDGAAGDAGTDSSVPFDSAFPQPDGSFDSGGGVDASVDAMVDSGRSDGARDDATRGDASRDAARDGAASCLRNSECASGFCNTRGGCMDPGLCVDRPASCAGMRMDPVCGCDGTSYRNPCMAAMAGVRVASAGTCE